jgi:beta-mannosidase
MDRLSLNGNWNLFFHIEENDMPETIDEVKRQNWDKIDAIVPGNIEIDLCRAGIEEDPFFGENLYSFRKYEFYQWWFDREFDVPADFDGKHSELVLHGLDTYGTIWINGLKIGETENMFIEHTLDISGILKKGESNHIAIRIKSPVNIARKMEYPVNARGCEGVDEMIWMRKAPHSFGWDIAPRLLSAGIWRNIEIKARKATYIREVYYATRWVKQDKAALIVKYRFETDEVFLDGFSVRISGICNGHSFEKIHKTRFCSDECIIDIDDPMLWWPKGYGEQNLYEMTFELLYNEDIIDRRCERIGIREVRLETKFVVGDEGEFKVHLNGCPILAKGTNWVPLDALHSRDSERLQKAHDLLEESGCNIVRCWGGNVYEDHEFFNLCDERGIMVWQDFSLACAIYPQSDDFMHVVENEAVFIVKKLRNHPSLLLWSGDNEVDAMHIWHGSLLPHSRYNRISREVLPRTAGGHDPYRPYIASSPYIPEDVNGDNDGPEQHNWGPRDYFKGDFYKHSTAHFISEIGYHGCPSVSSLKRFISEDKLWPFEDNDEWDTHNTEYIRCERRGYNRNTLMANQVKVMFGEIPDNLEEFAFASQISQAEAKKFFIEMVRLKKWRRTGIIWWNLFDCWPQISDAVVDYYFTKKLAFHYIKRVQTPICIMMAEMEGWQYKVVLGNDSRTDAIVKYMVTDGETDEIILSGEKISKANENLEIGAIKAIPGEQKLYLMTWEINGVEYSNHYVSGYVPLAFSKYTTWLEKIRALPQSFEYET